VIRRTVTAVAAAVLCGAFALAALPPSAPPGRGAGSEALEQAITTEQRLEALAAAEAAGLFGTDDRAAERAPARAAAGWTGQRLMDSRYDDWEPAVAADPSDPFVYLLSTRYGAGKPCQGNCPTPFIALEISEDGGATWGAPKALCACKGSGQYDPIIEVVPGTGEVYAVYMNGYNVVFIKSADHGRTWTEPVATYGKVSWTDKPVMATDASGRHVYVSWNGPNGGDPWIAQSHDAGVTWTQTKVRDNDRYHFAYDAVVAPGGTVVFSESSMIYANGDQIAGAVYQLAIISRNRGRDWKVVRVASVRPGQPCSDCRADYYIGHSGVTATATGRLVFTYDGAVTDYGRQRVYVTHSDDAGSTWSVPILLSVPGEHSSSPVVEARGSGDIRLVWMQTADGGVADRWNAWHVRSRDGGATWSAPKDISDRSSGAAYKHPDGFEEIYGDYGEIAITSEGQTIAVWGEAFSYAGPGGVWFNIGR